MNAKVLRLKCCHNDCEAFYSDQDVESVLRNTGNKEYDLLYAKYIKFKQIKLLEGDPEVRWCPRPGCELFVRKENKFQLKLTCECGQDICFKCGRAYHGRFFSPCDRQLDIQFEEWVKDKEVRVCPLCKAYIEKSEGCNHMTCYYCEF